MEFPAYTFKMYLTTKESDVFLNVPLLVGSLDIHILYGPLLNGATTVILREFHLILISVVLANYRET
jgi:acyl-coenzyme A synthetase/AMP-(fatty) acid ligase